MVGEEKSYDYALDYERKKYANLLDEKKILEKKICELEEENKTSCSEDEYNVIVALRNMMLKSSSINDLVDDKIQSHVEDWHYSHSEEE